MNNTATESPAMKQYPPSGLSILIVGAGVGGVMTALECCRKGHTVRILKRSPGSIETGDFFTIGPSAIKTFRFWPEMIEENENIAYDSWVSYHKHTGECIIPPGPMTWEASRDMKGMGDLPTRLYRHHRPKFHAMLLKQLDKLGVEVEYSHKVAEYFEEEGIGGVVLGTGEKIEAGLDMAADGVGTRSHALVAGKKVEAKSSGSSIYRTAYPVDLAMADAEIAERFKTLENGKSVNEIWVGPDMHMMLWRSEDMMSWLITHKDTGTVAESWHDHTSIEEVLQFTSSIPGWPSIMDRVIKTTHKDAIVDWKLIWRDPQPVWASPRGGVVQLGDAAHTFIPSSGNGGTQAIEDAVSLATCLQLGGKKGVEWAVRVHNKLRPERVTCCQILGFVDQNSYDHTDWEAVAKNPDSMKAKYGRWIWSHDVEGYAFEHYEKVLNHLAKGASFENTNVPAGYTYKPWTIEDWRRRR